MRMRIATVTLCYSTHGLALGDGVPLDGDNEPPLWLGWSVVRGSEL